MDEIGKVAGYYNGIGVASIEVLNDFLRNDRLIFVGHTTDFETRAESIQLDGRDIEQARAGTRVGVKVPQRVRPGDVVFRLFEED